MTPSRRTRRRAWHFAVDRGGTFTDVLGIAPDGVLHTHKLLSASPAYPDAVAEGVRRALARAGETRGLAAVAELRLGTTVATNALLERRGARVALAVTAGFEDLLAIGDQTRPELFALDIVKPAPLYGAVIGIPERLDGAGRAARPLDTARTLRALRVLRRAGYEALAVVLLHAWVNPAHELALAALARRAGFAHITLSHAVSGRIKAVPRGQAAMLDAYLTPVLRAYLNALAATLAGVPVQVMQSDGALVPAAQASGRAAVLSGPAGGAAAVAALARALRAPVLGFDMGGTSTDVCRSAGEPERTAEMRVAGVPFQADALRIETVAAGGGSVLDLAGTRLTVGPRSAGADPGPACYGRGGPATITDAQLVLGRLDPASMPRAFGPRGDAPLDAAAARRVLAELARRLRGTGGPRVGVEALALGYLAVADEQMAAPIRALSTARGHDARAHVLVPFGGAGGLHACAIARLLGIRRVVAEPLAGLYSALGIARAAREERATRSVLRALDPRGLARARSALDELAREASARLEAGPRRVRRWLELRPAGAEGAITLALADLPTLRTRFARAWRARHGYAPPRAIEISAVQVSVVRPGAPAWRTPAPAGPARRPDRRVVLVDGTRRIAVYRRAGLAPGHALVTPCVVRADDHTVLVEADFDARVDEAGRLVLERRAAVHPAPRSRAPRSADPVLLELWNRRLRALATEMGAALVASANSVNMKERLDFSCAVFDAAGRLIANAPHIPVHLGAMGESVRALIAARAPQLAPGQVWLTNHPARGGSHLPDLTVITPVFRRAGRAAGSRPGRPAWFVATRGHHADIGGPEPGSMSPFARTLAEEGVVFEHFLAVDAGRLRERALRAHLAAGPHPARSPDERVADLRAMLAANRLGERGLRALAAAHGPREVDAYMAHLRAHTADAVRAALAALLGAAPERTGACADALDDGTPVACAVRIERAEGGAHLHVDFAGTGPRHPGSFNAPRAVVRSAVLYTLRCLVARDIPLNEGALAAVTRSIPPGSLLDPPDDAAVVAGNVETAQRVVDVLLGALGVAAASQGTMNNVLLGFSGPPGAQYYETLGGGAGATAHAHGASAVQVHMTNTRATDPEVLEARLPGLRLTRFAVRAGSGGAGHHRGGDGLVREYALLAPARLTLLTQRRTRAPFGLAGGAPGRPGRNRLRRAGRTRALPPVGVWDLDAGDVLTIETPGGGGYGAAG